MFARSTRLDFILSLAFIVVMGACGNFGGCDACGSVGPLPPNTAQTLRGLPRDQTVEGGAQIRVTPSGFNKLTAILPSVINQQFTGGFCVPQGGVGGSFLGADFCYTNQGAGCNPGCRIGVQLNPGGLSLQVVNAQTLRIGISATLSTMLPIRGRALGLSVGSCTLNISSPNLGGNLDIAFGIRPADGELTINLAQINSLNLNMNINGCGILGDIADIAASLLDAIINSFVGQFALDLLTPTINNLIQGFLPNPLGLAGMLDVGSLLENISPGTDGFMEARIVPGGYVTLAGGGMSLGVITGVNADEDPATRGPGLTSEPHLCVPPLPAPNFGAPPASLPLTTRSTFRLDAAGQFAGNPGPPAGTDLAMGLSETMLDQLGHHMVTSGMLCLGVGTSFISQLNVGTIGLLVPSLSDLADSGTEPLLLVTRPQRAIDFKIGANTLASPALTLHISNLEVDFYGFIYGRYVRAFTANLTLDVGVNLEFEQPAGMPARIKPTLVGLSSSEVTVTVLNNEFVAESAQRLETVLPSVFDLVTPLIGNLPPIDVPTFAGFTLNNLSIQHITTSQDDFLAIYAALGSSTMMRQLAGNDLDAQKALALIDAGVKDAAPASTGQARLVRVTRPSPATVRAALAAEPGGALPEVVFDVDKVDARGRELEWSYNLDGGLFRPYTTPVGPLVVSDRAFAWQGKYTIGLKSRVKGDYTTVSETIETPVIIDSVGPRILAHKAAWDGAMYEIPLWDIVSERAVQHAFGKPGSEVPATAWIDGATARISRLELAKYVVDGELAVFARDEAGQVSIAAVAPFHGQPGEGGCECNAGAPSAGGLLLVGLVGVGLLGRRGRRSRLGRRIAVMARARHATTLGLWLGLSAVISLAPGCSCGKVGEKSCETAADCGDDFCPAGEIAFCIDNTCVCSDDIPLGRMGPYSDVAVGADGSTWVSAYDQSFGDLIVAKVLEPGRIPDEAWEWVDGVPDGPVLIPDSKYRGGIAAKGDDVGMYTSIAVAPDGTPMVSYFDRDTGSLKFAAKAGGAWAIHTIDAGTGTLGELGSRVGMFTSLSLRRDDGRPGIAYLAHVSDVNGPRAEVRYVSSQVPAPTRADDWQLWVVDTAPLPIDPTDPYPLPQGLGLFVDAARLPGEEPVVVYYDRGSGELKLSKFNPQSGQFGAARVLAGSANVDAGWSPSVAVSPDGVVHVAYVDATHDDLRYITDAPGAQSQLVDDGRRIVGTTVDGLPKPEYHFVGEDAGLVLANDGTTPMISYQDSTAHELRLATLAQSGDWEHIAIAGGANPWGGAYGFFAASAVTANEIVISTWVIDQPNNDNWVEVIRRLTVIQ